MLLIIIFSLVFGILSSKTDKATNVNLLKKGIVMVYNGDSSRGSGFAIGKKGEPVEYFLTCCHCVSDNVGNISTKPIYITANRSENADETYTAKIIYTDRDHDIAILKSEKSITGVIPLTLSAETAALGGTVFALGYPEEALYGLAEINWEAVSFSDGELVNSGVNVQISPNKLIYKDMYQTTIRITPGNSGGPTFDNKGNVIGLSSAGDAKSDNGSTLNSINSFSSKIRYAIDVLDEFDIEYSTYNDNHLLINIVSIALVLLIMATLVVLIIYYKLKHLPLFIVELIQTSELPSNLKQTIAYKEGLSLVVCNKYNDQIFASDIEAGQLYKLFFKGNSAINFSVADSSAVIKSLNRSIPIKAVSAKNNCIEEILPDYNKNGEVEIAIDHGYVFIGSDEYYIKFERQG